MPIKPEVLCVPPSLRSTQGHMYHLPAESTALDPKPSYKNQRSPAVQAQNTPEGQLSHIDTGCRDPDESANSTYFSARGCTNEPMKGTTGREARLLKK